MKYEKKKWIVVLLASAMAITMLSGCSNPLKKKNKSSDIEVKLNETISSDSKWIDSSIEGAIDASTKTSVKDDFYTAINKDWILEQSVGEKGSISQISLQTDIVKERMMDIVSGKNDQNSGTNVGISETDLQYAQNLVMTFAGKAGDWEERNKEGVEPARKYIEAIQNISSIDEMSDYLLNEDGLNFKNLNFISFSVTTTTNDATVNRAAIGLVPELCLNTQDMYQGLDDKTLIATKKINEKEIEYLFERLGYSKSEADKVLRKCYLFEGKLVDHLPDSEYQTTDEYKEAYNKLYKKATLESLQGSYPLMELLKKAGYDKTEKYLIMSPEYVEYLGKAYTKSNLEGMKAYLLVHTADALLENLDREAYDKYTEWTDETEKNQEKTTEDEPDGDGDRQEQEISDDNDILLKLVNAHLGGPLQTIYISRYCTKEQKEGIIQLTKEIIDKYHTILNDSKWLSKSARKKAIAKLDAITINAVYPDKLYAYDYISLDDSMNYVDMIAKINATADPTETEKIDAKTDNSEWDLESMPTTECNACYIPSHNSINIFAGIMADGYTYDVNQEKEVQLARIGTIVGHEISHGFDTTGYHYDKYGNEKDWMDILDQTSFLERSGKLISYYNAITPYPGGDNLIGDNLSGESIADMGGMKCALLIAKDKDDFDYDLFFKSYAQLWAKKCTMKKEEECATGDAHPLANLRVNITLQQFEEFYDTYDVEKGDGMYLAPKKRIAVW